MLDVASNTLGNGRGLGRRGLRQQDREFFAAKTGGDIGTPQGPAVPATNWAVYFPENGGEWTPGDAPKTMHHPRVGNALAFLDGALITVFGKDTTAAQPFAGLDTPE